VNVVSETDIYPDETKKTASHVHPPKAPDSLIAGEWQERDIVRVLVASGPELILVEGSDEQITVAEYILGNIKEVIDSFENKLFGKVVRECMEMVTQNKPLSSRHFVTHEDPEISALTIDLLQSPYEYSPGWEARDLYLSNQKMPDKNFQADSKSALLRFKLNKVIKLCEQNQQKIKAVTDNDDTAQMLQLLKVQAKLIEMRNFLARELGTVVLK
jgi:hypothetical protein